MVSKIEDIEEALVTFGFVFVLALLLAAAVFDFPNEDSDPRPPPDVFFATFLGPTSFRKSEKRLKYKQSYVTVLGVYQIGNSICLTNTSSSKSG